MLIIDSAMFEKQLFSMGHRGPMVDPQTGKTRAPKTMLSLAAVFRSFGIDVQCAFHNSGNDAFLTLLALQLLLDKDNTQVPSLRGRSIQGSRSSAIRPVPTQIPMMPAFPMAAQLSPNPMATSLSMNAYLDADFGVARRTPGHSQSTPRRGRGGASKNTMNRHSAAMDDLSSSMNNIKTG
jgi:hypothetical protein